MAFTDILAQPGDAQDFILEIPAGTLGTPSDIVVEAGSNALVLSEVPVITPGGGGGNIFVLSD